MLCNEVRFYIPRDVLLSPSYEVFVLTSAHIWWVTSFLGIIFTQYKSTGQRQDRRPFKYDPQHEMHMRWKYPWIFPFHLCKEHIKLIDNVYSIHYLHKQERFRESLLWTNFLIHSFPPFHMTTYLSNCGCFALCHLYVKLFKHNMMGRLMLKGLN